MDPNATLAVIRDAIKARDLTAAIAAREDLEEWIDNGGAEPRDAGRLMALVDALACADHDIVAMFAFVLDIAGVDYAEAHMFESAYIMEGDATDYAERLVEDGVLEIPPTLLPYFDFEKYGRDLELSGDIIVTGGYVFRGDW